MTPFAIETAGEHSVPSVAVNGYDRVAILEAGPLAHCRDDRFLTEYRGGRSRNLAHAVRRLAGLSFESVGLRQHRP